jgi:L-tyrosine isonitrile synthase
MMLAPALSADISLSADIEDARGRGSHRLEAAGAPVLRESVGPRNRAHERGDAAQALLRSFNTWHFKREQPSDPGEMLKVVAQAMSARQPVPFVLYWGKGPRCRIGVPDIECLGYLNQMAERVRAAYAPGAAIKLIFTDTHASLNGHSPASMESYFADVDEHARRFRFDSDRLGRLVSGLPKMDGGDDQTIPGELLVELRSSAAKWYRGAGTAEDGARQYYHMNMLERRAIERAFPHSIFVTFNSSKLRALFPRNLPIFYMYSMRRGVGVKPWFVPGAATQCEGGECRCVAAPDSGGAARL